MTRWAGIDEAGYGPNLGPLAMTAVVVESPDDRPPDVWGDLPRTVARAGGSEHKLWVDDSKKVNANRRGRDRLEAGTFALLAACGRPVSLDPAELFRALGAGEPDEVELASWQGSPKPGPRRDPETNPHWSAFRKVSPFANAPWRLIDSRTILMGPSRFNAGIARHGSKATVHFEAFVDLLRHLWSDRGAEITKVRCDKHGGRHFYADRLHAAFPEIGQIDRVEESAERSVYLLREGGRTLELTLEPRADANDGLVALASIASKTARERWMDVFNEFWMARVPNLKPTAGYPVDAARFRAAVADEAKRLGLADSLWWRVK